MKIGIDMPNPVCAAGKGEPRIVALTYFSVGEDDASKAYLRDYYAFLGPWVDRIVEARTPAAIKARVKATRTSARTS